MFQKRLNGKYGLRYVVDGCRSDYNHDRPNRNLGDRDLAAVMTQCLEQGSVAPPENTYDRLS